MRVGTRIVKFRYSQPEMSQKQNLTWSGFSSFTLVLLEEGPGQDKDVTYGVGVGGLLYGCQ